MQLSSQAIMLGSNVDGHKIKSYSNLYFLIIWKRGYVTEYMKFEVIVVVTMKNTVLPDVMLCSLVDIYCHFGGTGKIEAAHSIKTSVNFYQTTQHLISEVHSDCCHC
jgi:hypothetical protein